MSGYPPANLSACARNPTGIVAGKAPLKLDHHLTNRLGAKMLLSSNANCYCFSNFIGGFSQAVFDLTIAVLAQPEFAGDLIDHEENTYSCAVAAVNEQETRAATINTRRVERCIALPLLILAEQAYHHRKVQFH